MLTIENATRPKYTQVQDKGQHARSHADATLAPHSISVVLPVYNEEEVIATTVEDVLEVMNTC